MPRAAGSCSSNILNIECMCNRDTLFTTNDRISSLPRFTADALIGVLRKPVDKLSVTIRGHTKNIE